MGPTGVVGQDFYAPFSTGRPAQVRGGPGHGRWAESNWARQAWLARAPVRSSWSAGAVSVREWTPRSLRTFQLGIWKLIILSPFDFHDSSRRLPQHPRHYVPWERRERGGRRKETKRERRKPGEIQTTFFAARSDGDSRYSLESIAVMQKPKVDQKHWKVPQGLRAKKGRASYHYGSMTKF